MKRIMYLVTMLLVGALAVTACPAPESPPVVAPAVAATPEAAETPTEAEPGAEIPPILNVSENAQFGQILTDQEGTPYYTFSGEQEPEER